MARTRVSRANASTGHDNASESSAQSTTHPGKLQTLGRPLLLGFVCSVFKFFTGREPSQYCEVNKARDMTLAMPSGLTPEQRFAEFDWETARRKLLYYFSRRGLLNAEDLTQETLTRIVRWLGEGHKIEGPDGFMKTVFGFARMVRLEDTKKPRVSAGPLPEDLPAGTITTRGLNTQEAIQVLRQILKKLPKEDRDLILDWERGVPQEKMAADRNIPLSTLRVHLHRAREKVRRCYDSRRAEAK